MGENEAAMEYDQEFIFKHLQVAVFQIPNFVDCFLGAFIWILLRMQSKMV
jgi:hypothetical protein